MNKKQFLALAIVTVAIIATVALSFLGFGGATTSKTTNQTSTVMATPPPPSALPRINSYSINLPNTLILVDSQGRRTGKDPATGTKYHEIPGTTYFEEFQSGQLYFSSPPTGLYVLYVVGGQSGHYVVSSDVDDGGPQAPKSRVVSGDIQKGSVVAYTQSYNLANIGSSTLVFQSTASSTANITSEPPHNLPPPPVPGQK